ncbi:MAG: response regulator [Steroidobacteraceae bacterium]
MSIGETLGRDGHGVTTADGGQVGIDTFLAAQKRGEPFPVVITDLGMPYVDGRKVSSVVKTAAPGTVVLLLTGWGQRLIAEGDVPMHVDQVLSKPPKLSQLRAALARCCASAER